MKIGVETRIIETEPQPKQIIVPDEFSNLYIPDKYQEGMINYVGACVSSSGSQEMKNRAGFVETLCDDMRKINQYAGERGLYGMVILVPPTQPPETSFRLMLALMEKGKNFRSMVRGLGQYYDGIGWGLEYFHDYKKGSRTQVDDMRDLLEGQRAADSQITLAVDGLRRAIYGLGSADVPSLPFDGLHVRAPINVDEKNNGRVREPEGDWVVPCVEPNKFGGNRSWRYSDNGYATSTTGWIAVDELKEQL